MSRPRVGTRGQRRENKKNVPSERRSTRGIVTHVVGEVDKPLTGDHPAEYVHATDDGHDAHAEGHQDDVTTSNPPLLEPPLPLRPQDVVEYGDGNAADADAR